MNIDIPKPAWRPDSRVSGLVVVMFCLLNFGTTRAAEPGWQFERYSDPMNRGASIAAASQVSAPTDNGSTVTVLVRCWSATREVDIRFTVTTGPPPESEAVSWQFDNKARRSGSWRLAQSGYAVVVPVAIRDAFLRELQRYRRVTLLLDKRRSFNIRLTGSSQAIANVQHTCQRR